MEGLFYKTLLKSIAEKEKQLAILIDPDKFVIAEAKSFLKKIPKETTHLFVGGSTVKNGETEKNRKSFKSWNKASHFSVSGRLFAHNSIGRCTFISDFTFGKKCRIFSWAANKIHFKIEKFGFGNYFNRLYFN
jgi:hypothetical protein